MWYRAVPPALKARGVDEATWAGRMDELKRVQAKARVCDFGRVLNCLCMLVAMLAFPCWLFYGMPWSSCDPFQLAFKKWLRKFNAEVLEPKGIYLKAFSFGRRAAGGQPTNKDSNNLPVLVFALTKKEIARLKSEAVLQMPMKTDTEIDKQYACWGCMCLHSARAV